MATKRNVRTKIYRKQKLILMIVADVTVYVPVNFPGKVFIGYAHLFADVLIIVFPLEINVVDLSPKMSFFVAFNRKTCH